MDPTTHELLNFSGEEIAILSEMLEAERSKLLVEVRHTDHRTFRDELRHKLDVIERLIERFRQP